MPSLSPRRPFLLLAALLSLGFFNACDDSADDPSVIPDLREAFTSSLDSAQLTTAPKVGTAVRVIVRSRTQPLSNVQSPVWVGFHDGTVDTFNQGSASTLLMGGDALERLAEDGDTTGVESFFDSALGAGEQRTLAGVLDPEPGILGAGEQVAVTLRLDPQDPNNRYFSYLSQIRPSNDAFVGNDDPIAHEIFDAGGNFVASDFVILGTSTWDAGTEANDELAASTAGWQQATPNTGTPEFGVVDAHPGYNLPLTGGVLDQTEFFFALFLQMGYEFATVSFDEVPVSQTASGTATYQLNSSGTSLDFEVMLSDLSSGVTGLKIFQGAPGTDGLERFDLSSGIQVNADGVLVADGFFSLAPFERDALLGGEYYLVVETVLNPAGELRGQIDSAAGELYLAGLSEGAVVATPTRGRDLRVTAYNPAPENGTFLSPVWVGFHDGTFDVFDTGSAANTNFPVANGLERLAEDGTTADFDTDFEAHGDGRVVSTLRGLAGVLEPGETVSRLIRLDPTNPLDRYFTYATMVLPSNDAFIAPEDPLTYPVYDAGGTFQPVEFLVSGGGVQDAGTEVNDELPMNTALFGQTTPNTGTDEMGVVGFHPGFLAPGMGGILDDPQFAAADFTQAFYRPLGILVQEVPGTPAAASGSVTATFDEGTDMLTLVIFVEGLSGPATSVQLLQGSSGEAGIVFAEFLSDATLNDNGSLRLTSTVPLSETQEDALDDGRLAVRITTDLNVSGELRGQLEEAD